MKMDIIIKNGNIIDGSGSKPYKSDIAIRNDKIFDINHYNETDIGAEFIIDANNLYVCPGFIDVHSHADVALLNDGQHASGIMQGITTEIIAPDGLTLAPLSKNNYELYKWYLSGILGTPKNEYDMSSLKKARLNYDNKTACNVAMFAGHGPIRLETLGMKDIPLVGKQLDNAKSLLSECFEEGAVGFSTGLSYYPNSYSDSNEICELMKIAKKYDKPMSIHLRNHNTDRAFHNGGILEAIEIAKRTETKLHIEHYKPDFNQSINDVLDPVDQAKKEGVDITLETYPYPVGSSFPQAFFPGYFHEGGPEKMLEKLKDKEERKTLISKMIETHYGNPSNNVWTHINSEKNKYLEGMLFDEVAEMWNISVEEMVCKVMYEESLGCGFRGAPPRNIKTWRQVEKNVMELLSRPDYMIGSDAIPTGGLPHPRAFGCFPRVLGRLRRRYNFPIEQVVQRITENPAQRFNLHRRGKIIKDNFADIVILDKDHLNDRSTFEDPNVHPEGIYWVIVNGKIAVKNEKTTGILSGKAIP
tara:strand:- start:421 stop:2007 length:1587 start_codon:yes stop_codon:yes gene_type:complete